MTIGFIGRTTLASELKASLDASAQRSRTIADRVSRASVQAPAFSLPAAAGSSAGQPAATEAPIDVESEMVNLADEQLRYATTAKLLQKTYAGLHESLQSK
jgi:flagellar basal body rod protein FlgB